jgi:hypothetical protein
MRRSVGGCERWRSAAFAMQRIDDEGVGRGRAALGQRVQQRHGVALELQQRVGEVHRVAADLAGVLVGGVFAGVALADAGDET